MNKYHKKKDCLQQNKCGYCEGEKGKGLCLSSTPSGPINLDYKMCHPSSGSIEKNKFIMGEPNGYILTPSDPDTLLYPTIKNLNKSSDSNLLPMV